MCAEELAAAGSSLPYPVATNYICIPIPIDPAGLCTSLCYKMGASFKKTGGHTPAQETEKAISRPSCSYVRFGMFRVCLEGITFHFKPQHWDVRLEVRINCLQTGDNPLINTDIGVTNHLYFLLGHPSRILNWMKHHG